MSKFAEGTSVPVEKSRAEIEKLIIRYGATSTAFMNAPGRLDFLNPAVRFFGGTSPSVPRWPQLRVAEPNPKPRC